MQRTANSPADAAALALVASKLALIARVWLCGYNVLLYLVFSKLFAMFVAHGQRPDVDNIPALSLGMLVRIQGIINGCLTGIPLFYKIYRIIRRPSFLLTFLRAIAEQCKGNIGVYGVVSGASCCFF